MALSAEQTSWREGFRSRSRRISDDEYEEYHAKILDLYLRQGKSRDEIITILANEDSFVISLKQLKHRLHKWKARKNAKHSPSSPGTCQPRPPRYRGSKIDPSRNGPSADQTKPEPQEPGHEAAAIRAWNPHTPHEPPSSNADHGSHLDYLQVQTDDNHITDTGRDSHNLSDNPSLPPDVWPVPPADSSFSGNHSSHRRDLGLQYAASSTAGPSCSIPPFQAGIHSPYHTSGALSTAFDFNGDQPGLSSLCGEGLPDVLAASSTDLNHTFEAVTAATTRHEQLDQPLNNIPIRQHFPPTPPHSLSDADALTTIGLLGSSSSEADLGVILPLLLKLRSLSVQFATLGHQWQTPWGSGLDGSSYPVICAMLISPWVQTAFKSSLCDYLQRSINLLTSTKQTSQDLNVMISDNASDPILAAHVDRSQNTPRGDQLGNQPAPTVGHEAVLSLAAKESRTADMIKLKARKWPRAAHRPLEGGVNASLTMSYIPHAFQRIHGIALTLRGSSISYNPNPSPIIRTFGVIPSDSKVIQCIKYNDSDGVRRLFSLGQAKPTDVDSEGRSLLSYAIRYRSLEIFRMLLENGACAEDVDNGLDVVTSIWVRYVLRDPDKNLLRETQHCIDMTNLALKSGADFAEYGHQVYAGLSVLNKVKQVDCVTALPVIEYIVSMFQLDAKGPSERTPLLCACTTNSSLTLQHLVAKGANVHALDGFGRGALHSALYVRSYVICPESCGKTPHGTPHQCACPFDTKLHDLHYIHAWRECPRHQTSGLMETLVQLLRAGCDLNLRDHYGMTPRDYAERLPDLWEIWRLALVESVRVFEIHAGIDEMRDGLY